MNSEKYIGYLESQIADTMWPSGLRREERKPFQQVCLRLETAKFCGFAEPAFETPSNFGADFSCSSIYSRSLFTRFAIARVSAPTCAHILGGRPNDFSGRRLPHIQDEE